MTPSANIRCSVESEQRGDVATVAKHEEACYEVSSTCVCL